MDERPYIITADKDWQIRRVYSMKEYWRIRTERYIKLLLEGVDVQVA